MMVLSGRPAPLGAWVCYTGLELRKVRHMGFLGILRFFTVSPQPPDLTPIPQGLFLPGNRLYFCGLEESLGPPDTHLLSPDHYSRGQGHRAF